MLDLQQFKASFDIAPLKENIELPLSLLLKLLQRQFFRDEVCVVGPLASTDRRNVKAFNPSVIRMKMSKAHVKCVINK